MRHCKDCERSHQLGERANARVGARRTSSGKASQIMSSFRLDAAAHKVRLQKFLNGLLAQERHDTELETSRPEQASGGRAVLLRLVKPEPWVRGVRRHTPAAPAIAPCVRARSEVRPDGQTLRECRQGRRRERRRREKPRAATLGACVMKSSADWSTTTRRSRSLLGPALPDTLDPN